MLHVLVRHYPQNPQTERTTTHTLTGQTDRQTETETERQKQRHVLFFTLYFVLICSVFAFVLFDWCVWGVRVGGGGRGC